ncbi:hypothetical protein [Stappia stellulata]|uniref:hypothetical protein n=1 Tax=Stappia stellulata TaxID=71235 RepID=UPI000427362D|nr:hypothetical protein [Stappia stellulata]
MSHANRAPGPRASRPLSVSPRKIAHRTAGLLAFAMIATFWVSTVVSELVGSAQAVAAVKQAILYAMIVLVPALAVAGASGFSLGKGRSGARIDAKRRRMPLIAANGILILVPSAVFLAMKARAGIFDTPFYTVQAVELVAGALNLFLIGRNIADGLAVSGRLRRARPAH